MKIITKLYNSKLPGYDNIGPCSSIKDVSTIGLIGDPLVRIFNLSLLSGCVCPWEIKYSKGYTGVQERWSFSAIQSSFYIFIKYAYLW